MSSVIAIAGAGALGRTILDVLKTTSEYQVKVFSRKKEKEIDFPIISVDYNDVESLAQALETNNIDTVICTMAVVDEISSQAQFNLIKAADKAACTRRFIPSEFGIPFHEKLVETFPLVAFKLQAYALLKTTSLEYTLFHNGMFLDFYGAPKVPSYIRPFALVIDMDHNQAAIPGLGDVPAVFTHTSDIAKYVVASLSMDRWPERLFMAGDRLSWIEFVRLAESVKGTKFHVVHDDPDELEKGNMTLLPSHEDMFQFLPKAFATRLMSALEYWTAIGEFDMQFDECTSLNGIFPLIKPTTVMEVLQRGRD